MLAVTTFGYNKIPLITVPMGWQDVVGLNIFSILLPRQHYCHFLLNITASIFSQQFLWENIKFTYKSGVKMTRLDLFVHPPHDSLFMPSLSDHTQLITTTTGPKGIRAITFVMGIFSLFPYLFHSKLYPRF